MTRATRLLSLSAAAALLVAACGSSAPAASPVASDAPTTAPATTAPTASPSVAPSEPPAAASPSADASAPDLEGAAEALDAIQKYQLDMTINGTLPGLPGENEITMSGLVDQSSDAFQFEMAGMEGLGTAENPVQFVVIGDDAWVNLGGTGFLEQPGGASSFDQLRTSLAPATLLGQFPTTGMDFLKVGDEDKNGVSASHYHAEGSQIPQVAQAIGEDGVMDFWIANDGGYLVSMAMTGTIEGAAMNMTIDLSRVNDDSIAIEAPN